MSHLALAYAAPQTITPVDASIVSNIEDRLTHFLSLSPTTQARVRRQLAADIVAAVLVLSKAAPAVHIDAVTPEFCSWCSCRHVDPDNAPYCSRICAISAESE